MPLKTRPWIRLVLKKCPVSIGNVVCRVVLRLVERLVEGQNFRHTIVRQVDRTMEETQMVSA